MNPLIYRKLTGLQIGLTGRQPKHTVPGSNSGPVFIKKNRISHEAIGQATQEYGGLSNAAKASSPYTETLTIRKMAEQINKNGRVDYSRL
jgi:hypothetical protein